MTARRALLLLNPRSRSGARAAPAVFAALSDHGFGITAPAADLSLADAIARHADGADMVIAAGGDGTLNGVINALAAGPGLDALPLGVVPLGTANDFARTLAIPTDPAQAIATIAAGHQTSVDVGEVNGHYYLNVASIGFGVDLTRALTRDSKARWGPLGYAIAGIRALSRLKPFTAEIDHGDHIDRTRTVHLAIGNGRHYGGGMVVDPAARLDDGRLDAFSLEVDHWWQLLRLLPALRAGTHGRWTEVRTLAGEALTVRTSRPRSVNTDGEITTRTPAVFRVHPGAIRVFVPASAD